MSSDAHLRRDHGTPTSSDPFIDWGPDLPGRYDGGRARLLVANPRALFITWESGSQPQRWRLVIETGATPRVIDLPGHAGDAWLPVSPRSRGQVKLVYDDAVVATLPFETPPDGPSDDTSERWGRLDDEGSVQAAGGIGGNAVGPEAIARRDATQGTSSGVPRGG